MTAVSLAPAWVDDDLGYSAFYQRYHQPLTCYLRMGFRDADVEAITQETFCRALTRWPEVRSMTTPWPWLAVTARNLARNNIRDQKSTHAAGLEVFDPATTSGDDVAEQVEASDDLHRLAQAMSVLTPLQKRLVTVMVEEGLTGAQLARRLDMRPGAVRMHLCRMRLRLGERFASLGGVLGIAPVALVGLLRRLRPSSVRAHAGSASLTASVAAAAMGIAVIGVLPALPNLSDGTSRGPVTTSGMTHANWTTGASPARATRRVRDMRVTAPVAHRASHAQVVATAEAVSVAGEVRTDGRVSVDKRGDHETATDLVNRCLQHVTVNEHYAACDGSGNGTQNSPPE